MAGNATANPPRKREPAKAEFEKARAFELGIADEARTLRDHAEALTPDLFHLLYHLACLPIPKGFIVEVSRGDGKPYDSKGIRSVQVQIARMNAVFTPLWWDLDTSYHEEGKLCEVTVAVHVEGRTVQRSAWGGVDRANTRGNLHKGAFTNAAKLALARFGVGGEVYMGAADFDPDVNPDAAREQARTDRSPSASPVADAGPAELEMRTEALACAREILDRNIWTKQRLKAEMLSAKAADTTSVGKGVASIPLAELQALVSKMMDLLPPVTETGKDDLA